MKYALAAAGLLIATGIAVAQMFPCAIAISHCWTGREVTETLNRYFPPPR